MSAARWYTEAIFYLELKSMAFREKYAIEGYGRIPGTDRTAIFNMGYIALGWLILSLVCILAKK
jgi:hypothetical protein